MSSIRVCSDKVFLVRMPHGAWFNHAIKTNQPLQYALWTKQDLQEYNPHQFSQDIKSEDDAYRATGTGWNSRGGRGDEDKFEYHPFLAVSGRRKQYIRCDSHFKKVFV
jgi:hypothetical protein